MSCEGTVSLLTTSTTLSHLDKKVWKRFRLKKGTEVWCRSRFSEREGDMALFLFNFFQGISFIHLETTLPFAKEKTERETKILKRGASWIKGWVP